MTGLYPDDEEKEIMEEFEENVNVTEDELRAWKDTEASKKASQSREPVNDAIELIEKKKQGKWQDKNDGFNEFEEARQLNSFVARMSGMEDGDDINEEIGMSKRDVSLVNWGHVPEDERQDFEDLI